MREVFGMAEGGAIVFELGVSCLDGKLTINNSAIMVRKPSPEVAEIRKKMSFVDIGIYPLDGMPKVILDISKA